MKLWYSTTSPFVRKVLVALKHHQLLEQVELLTVKSSFDANSPHNQDNPLGRIPALQTQQGNWLFNSYFIAEYLDHLGTQKKLFPQNEQRWQILHLHHLADGILENTVPMLAERFLRPESEWWTARHQQITERNLRSLAHLEKNISEVNQELNIGTINLVCLVDFFLFRQNAIGIDLAQVSPNLFKWAVAMNEIYPVLAETKPFVNT